MRRSVHATILLSSFFRRGDRTRRDEQGFTIIELLIVVAIVGILAIALGFTYEGWMGRYKVEKATKDLYSDLMTARVNAMTRQRTFFITVSAANYSMSADTNDSDALDAGDTVQPAFPKAAEYPLRWDNAVPVSEVISFDKRGTMTNWGTISLVIPSAETDPDYDCIIIAQTRINMGKMTGGNCIAK